MEPVSWKGSLPRLSEAGHVGNGDVKGTEAQLALSPQWAQEIPLASEEEGEAQSVKGKARSS